MPNLSVGVAHALGREEAVRRLKEEFLNAKARFGQQLSDLEEEWNGNVLRFAFTSFGIRVRGTVTPDDSEVKVAAELPLVALPLKGAVERQIRDELGRILA